MAARVQQLVLGLSTGKQTDIATAKSTGFLRFKKLNSDLTSPGFGTENDAAEFGKGNEFISAAGVFPTAWSHGNRLEKYASAEWVAWVMAFALGSVSETPHNASAPAPAYSTYVITPIDPATTLILPYFTLIEQVPEGGSTAIDNMFVGCALEDFAFDFNYGPGRASAKLTANWVGSGKLTQPSGIVVPATLAENYMLSQSATVSIVTVDYVANGTILAGSIGWKNNLLLGAGFYPGSGLQSGAAIRGRMEIGARVPTLQFTARLLSSSTEYTKLIAQTTGTVTITFTYDAYDSVSFVFQSVSFEAVENVDVDGIVAVRVTCAPKWHATNGLLTVTAKSQVQGIAA